MVSGTSSVYAEPISILICSAVRSPISRFVFSLQIIRDGFIHVIAGNTQRARIDDAGERDDGGHLAPLVARPLGYLQAFRKRT